MKYKHPAPSPSSIWLGKRIERIRTFKNIPIKQVSKLLKETEQQIIKMERGAFISLPKLQLMAELFDMPIQKRIIRKISALRKLEQENKTSYDDELQALYEEALSDD